MSKFGKIFLLSSAIILLAAACSRGQDLKNVNRNALPQQQQSYHNPADGYPVPQTAPKPSGQTRMPAPEGAANGGQAQTRDNPNSPDYFPNQGPAYFFVNETVQGSNLNLPSNEVVLNTTAIQLLKAGHRVETKDYGAGMGEMVLSIDGIAPDSGHFWEFLVNGKFSNVGASTYKLKEGDKIEWKLDAINNSNE